MLMSAASQRVILRRADSAVPDGGHGPVATFLPEHCVCGESSLDQNGLSGSFRDGREAEIPSQSVQIA